MQREVERRGGREDRSAALLEANVSRVRLALHRTGFTAEADDAFGPSSEAAPKTLHVRKAIVFLSSCSTSVIK